MPKAALSVFDGLPIPVDYASTQTYALLARRDAGKTYTTLKLEEQMCDAGLFFVTLDPVGKHWALRAGADGKARGGKKDVWVLGGNHGDVPLEPTSGELIADTVIAHPGRYILDVSTFDTDAEQDRFALAFGQRLFRRKAKDPGFPILLILEEAESFIPQVPQSGQQRMLGVYGKIMRQGRNFGLGMLLVAQRSQALNKGVLSQAEVLIVKQMSHNRDIDAVDEWVKANGTPEQRSELLGSLASLAQNEAYVWSPSWLRAFRRTVVLPRVTFDSSASVKGGQEARAVDLVPLDVAALGAQIATVAERAKSDDPKALRARVKELEARLAAGEPERVEAPIEVVPPAVREGVDRADNELGKAIARTVVLGEYVRELGAVLGQVARELRTIPELQQSAASKAPHPDRSPSPAGAVRVCPPTRPVAVASPGPAAASNGDAFSPQGKVLNALAWWETVGISPASRLQVAMVAGYHPRTNAFTAALAELLTEGLIDYPERGMVRMLEAGAARARRPSEVATTEAVQEMVFRQVGPDKAEYLRVVLVKHPEPIARTDLAEVLGYHPRTNKFTGTLASLRALGLIKFPRSGFVAAEDVLFI